MKGKKIISAALAGVMALSLTACGGGSAQETTAAPAAGSKAEETTAAGTEGGTLIVGFDQDFPPMGF